MSSKIGAVVFLILFTGIIILSGSSKSVCDKGCDKGCLSINPGDTLGVISTRNYTLITKFKGNYHQKLLLLSSIPDSTMGAIGPSNAILYSTTWPPDTPMIANTCYATYSLSWPPDTTH